MGKERDKFVLNGLVVKKLRREKGLTQEDLAAKTGIARKTMQRIEKGEPIYPSTLGLLAEALDVDPKLLTGPENKSGPIAEAIQKRLCPFDAFINERSNGFVGRQFVFDALDEFLEDPSISSGYFLIEAKPGMGKSAFLSRLVEKREYAVHHFNIAAQGINTARQFLGNVCARLITNYKLPYSELPDDFGKDGAFLSKLLDEVGQKLSDDEQLVIAVDALDEVDISGKPDMANVLFLPSTLPPNVYIVATARNIADLQLRVSNIRPFELIGSHEENRLDVRTYLEFYAKREKISEWMKKRRISAKKFVDTMLDKSEGNFMYVHYILPELERGAYETLDFEDIPVGLENYYEDHWRRMGMMSSPLPQTKIRIIYILSVVRQTVSLKLLSDFAHADQVDVQEVLDSWRQFLHRQSVDDVARYSIYHASFRDFLYRKDIVQAASVNLDDINDIIADNLLGDLF